MTLAATKEPTLSDLYEQLEQALKTKKPKSLLLDEIRMKIAVARRVMMGKPKSQAYVEGVSIEEQVNADRLKSVANLPLCYRRILTEVSVKHSIPEKEIQSKSRIRSTSRARLELIGRCRDDAKLTYGQIGLHLQMGNGAVINAYNRWHRLLRKKARGNSNRKPAIEKFRGWDQVTLPKRDEAFEKIISEVCKKHDISISYLRSHDQLKRLALARAEIAYKGRYERFLSSTQIASYLSKDHTSVLNASRKWERLLKYKETGDPSVIKRQERNIDWSLVE